MVFRCVLADTDTHHQEHQLHIYTKFTSSVMAAAGSSTAKPPHQPLHNFTLPDLKWSSVNHTHNHRFRKLAAPNSSQKSPSHRHSAAAALNRRNEKKKSEKKSDVVIAKKSSLLIRIRTKGSNCVKEEVTAKTGDQAPLAEEEVAKTWNLRPRRAVTKTRNGSGGTLKIGGAAGQDANAQAPNRSELGRSQNGNDGKLGEKKENQQKKEKGVLKFAIPLTKEEIEEDILVLTGSKPARRPKKRAKHVQKQLNSLFPGLWLDSITPDSYRVSDAPPRVK